MNIRLAQSSDRTAWDAYVMQHQEGTLFHLIAWKNVIEKSFGHKSYYLMAMEKDEKMQDARIAGILPLFRIKSFIFGDYLVSVPFAELGGPVADNEKVCKSLLDHAINIAEEIKCDYLELRNREKLPNLCSKSLYFNFSKEIFPNVDDNMQAIPRKARRMIRVGGKKGLTYKFYSQLPDEFYEIMAKSFHSLGTPVFSQKFFKNFINEFKGTVDTMIVRNSEGVPVSGVLTFYFKDRVMPYYAGSIFQYRKLAPNDFMYWELIKHGCEKGYRIFDFGRSKADTGSFHFKRHWGFKPEPIAYQYQLIQLKEMPNLSPSNPKYKKKIELWKKLPYAATKIIGPLIARYLA